MYPKLALMLLPLSCWNYRCVSPYPKEIKIPARKIQIFLFIY